MTDDGNETGVAGAVGLRELSLTSLLGAGAGAYLGGYLLTILVAVVGPSSTPGDLGVVVTQMAFVFYSAHSVPLVVDGIGRLDWLTIAASASTPDPAVPVIVFYAIPIVVLTGTALVVTSRSLANRTDPLSVAGSIIPFALAYGLLMILGTVVFTSQSISGGPARLVLSDAALFGFVYPLLFGAIGAGVAGLLSAVRDRGAAAS